MRGGGRIGWGERHAFAGFFGSTVVHSLLPRNSNSEDSKRGEDGVPVLLTKVVDNVVRVSSGPWPPELRVELVSWFNKVTGRVRLVCTFDLIRVSVQQ